MAVKPEIDLTKGPINPFGVWNTRASIPGLRSVMSLELDETTAEIESAKLVIGVFDFLGDNLNGKDIYEIGGGTGRFTRELVKRAKSVKTIDLSRPMLQRAIASASASEKQNTHFIQGSGSHSPFQDESFDYVFEVTTLLHMPDEYFELILSEAKRVLRPEGKIFLCGPLVEGTPIQVHQYQFRRTLFQYEDALRPLKIQSSKLIQCGNDSYTMMDAGE